MRTGHLFAGAGGGLYADLILGHTPVFAVEWDEHAAGKLQQRAREGWFPELRVHKEDVRLFDPSKYRGKLDSLHAGFPCQDISVAGHGSGITGERSGLWSEVKKAADILGIGELFLENSPAITSRGLDVVLGDLAELGFDARWCVLPASAVGAPHFRARWWCLARRTNTNKGLGGQGSNQQPERKEHCGLCKNDSSNTDRKRCGKTGGFRPGSKLGPSGLCEKVSNANGKQLREQQKPLTQGGEARITGADGQTQPLANPTCERLEKYDFLRGGPEKKAKPHPGPALERGGWWSTEPLLGRVANGVADRVNRIKCLGNGQVPLQAAAAYMLLDAMLKG